ncbi:MAG: class I SAM-dependent methyltransferase [Chloroflexi bacterium]|nr:class I SAM-dependent methyltransferase [Chloroflexota bacterium]
MPHKFEPAHKERLLSQERKRLLDPERVIALLPMEPRHSIADIGCGPGFFTLPIARHIPTGRVYAIDIQEEMLEAVRARIAEEDVKNVEVRLSGEMELPLENESVDGAFLAFVLHETEDKVAFLKRIAKALKPGGWLAVIEWYKKEMEEGPPAYERLSEAQVQRLAKKAGFVQTRKLPLNEMHYFILFKKA